MGGEWTPRGIPSMVLKFAVQSAGGGRRPGGTRPGSHLFLLSSSDDERHGGPAAKKAKTASEEITAEYSSQREDGDGSAAAANEGGTYPARGHPQLAILREVLAGADQTLEANHGHKKSRCVRPRVLCTVARQS